jgi:hypothetical protein
VIGDTIAGTSTLTETGNQTHSLNDSGSDGGYAYSVNEYSTQPFTIIQTTNNVNSLQTTNETFDTSYTMVETSATPTGSWTLTENGIDTISQYQTSNLLTGAYTQTQTGTDAYTLIETGTLSGAFSESVTGTDTISQLEVGNSIQGTYTKDLAGGGSYSLSEAGGSLASGSGTSRYSLTETANVLTGNISSNETGTDRYELLQEFVNIADTNGVTTPGHMEYSLFGIAFVDGNPVGHHYVPFSVLNDANIHPWLSTDAYKMGMGAYSGPTFPKHNYGELNGVKHSKYNELVETELKKLIKNNKGKVISADQMEKFIENIMNGKGFNGKPNKGIEAFNKEIHNRRNAFVQKYGNTTNHNPQNSKKWVENGKKYMEGAGARRLIKAAAIASGIVAWLVSDGTGALAAAADSPHFKNAIGALADGDLALADRELFGEGNARHSNCFYQELVDKKLEKIAILFEEFYQKKMENIDGSLSVLERKTGIIPSDK